MKLEETDLEICHRTLGGKLGGEGDSYAWKSQKPSKPARDHPHKEKVHITDWDLNCTDCTYFSCKRHDPKLIGPNGYLIIPDGFLNIFSQPFERT